MLDSALKEQVKQIFNGLEAEYVFDISVGATHPSRTELIDMLNDTASCSPKISCKVNDGEDLSFRLLKNGNDTGIRFKSIPNGHEFSSLLLAVLNADGKGKNLPDASTAKRIKALPEAELTTYMSLTCTNCPDVVQALNVMAILNPGITHTAVDGALYQEEVDRLHVQAVPTVYANGQLLHVGRSDMGQLLNELEEKLGVETQFEATERHYDVVVAGGGPAGSAAAIYAARKGQKVAIVAGRIGGQVNETVGIENVISVPYTTGNQLATDLRKHLESYDIEICDNRTIESLEIADHEKRLIAKGGEAFVSPALIIATGASWRKLGVPGEDTYIGRGVAFCPHCDGPFYKGKHVAVIGGGNSGIEAAIDLAGICSKVTVLEFMDSLKADSVLQEKLHSLPNVEVYTSMQTLEVIGDGNKMTALQLKNRTNSEEQTMPLDGVFVQIGLTANSAPFKGKVEMNNRGEIVVDRNCRTAIAGIYGAGDVTDTAYKQIIIAMGEGAKAALSAFDDKVRNIL